ncbi:hypothetical protein Afil01_29800 [Actinorhabdospora filicis]|uniref:Uncharacterized protein n=1 Tax=Actinorhabdospora filicis TaxID=1785913 RepID=A0A9W6W9N1_9ACTN|nr:hypothetical protein [Actinorhabdospora filicis]GLZ78173.1 hypothetical protein Afil01_29800 [Actinorhabdospora filicis]
MISRLVSLTVAIVAAIGWAIGIAIVQPATQPEQFGSTNTYWARDARLMLIALTLAAFVWAVKGDWRRVAAGAAGALAWVGVDVALDRAELSGTRAAVITATIAVAAMVAAWLAARPQGTHANRTALILAGAVAAVTTGIGAAIESPTDTEPSLTVAGALIGVLGTVVVLGCALALAPSGRGVLFGVGAVALAIVAGIRLTSTEPTALLLGLALVALLVAALGVHATGNRRVTTWASGIAGTLGALVCLGMPVIMMSMVVGTGTLLTALAGNPPINAADEDVLLSASAAIVGLAIGAILVKIADAAADAPRRARAYAASQPPRDHMWEARREGWDV